MKRKISQTVWGKLNTTLQNDTVPLCKICSFLIQNAPLLEEVRLVAKCNILNLKRGKGRRQKICHTYLKGLISWNLM
jgi:hypothetical protein